MSMETAKSLVTLLNDKANLMRIHSIRSTTEAGSGHPTSCASAAEIMSALFFAVMRYDPNDPVHPDNDFFVLSKGHAAPLLYAAWAEAGLIPKEELLRLRKLDSDLEGHPSPKLPFVDVATGSLGQGLSAGVGMALAARLDNRDHRIHVLMGDGESAEGSVWEAAAMAADEGLGNLCATVDVNRLGQSEPTMLKHDMDTYRIRWEAFGWQALVVDGHDVAELLEAYEKAAATSDRPTVLLARTYKGRGIEFAEDKDGFPVKRLIGVRSFRFRMGGRRQTRDSRRVRATQSVTRSRHARPLAPPWLRLQGPTPAWLPWMAMSKTRPSPRTSRKSRRSASSKALSPSRTWWARP